MVTFAVEPLAGVWDEWMALVKLHWDETELYRGEPLCPRKEAYLQYDAAGMFFLSTIRDGVRLVGYSGMYVFPSMHTSQLFAREDTWYLHPDYRKGFTIVRFLRFVEKALVSRGARSCWMSAKTSNGAGRILEFAGYRHIANTYIKTLDEASHVRS